MASVSTFTPAFLSQYHVSFSSVVSGTSLRNCPYILLFFFIVPSFPSSACLNSFLFTVSLYYVVSAAFTPSINGSTEFLTYNPKLFSFIFINHSQLINPLPLVSLIRYTLWISLLRCSAPCIVINFLVLLPKFSIQQHSISEFLCHISLQKLPKY